MPFCPILLPFALNSMLEGTMENSFELLSVRQKIYYILKKKKNIFIA